jgi:hypothetical protein
VIKTPKIVNESGLNTSFPCIPVPWHSLTIRSSTHNLPSSFFSPSYA